MSKESIEFLGKINPSFKNMDIDNTNTFGGKFLLYCIDKALNEGQSLTKEPKTLLALGGIGGISRNELITAWRDLGNDVFCERLNKTGEIHPTTEDECFETMIRIINYYR